MGVRVFLAPRNGSTAVTQTWGLRGEVTDGLAWPAAVGAVHPPPPPHPLRAPFCDSRMIFILALLLVPFLRTADAFFFVSSTKVHLLLHASGHAANQHGRHPEHTLRGSAEEGSAAHSTENAAAAEATPPSATAPQTGRLDFSNLLGVAASTTGGISVPTRAPRVYLGGSNLHVGKTIKLTAEQTRYLVSVMRLRSGSPVRVFDGVNGEFLAAVSSSGGRGGMNRAKRSGVSGEQSVKLRVDCLIRQQPGGNSSSGDSSEGQEVAAPDVELIFAPIRKQRLKLMVEKTVELGVSRLTPVLTARTQKGAVSDPKALGKLGLGTAVEAAEQCERLTVPRVGETPVPLLSLLHDVELQYFCRTRGSGTDAEGGQDSEAGCLLPETIFVCMERGTDAKPILEALAEYARDRQGDATSVGDRGSSGITQNAEAAFLVGPEGGFDPDEISAMAAYPFVRFVSLGPLVLRAETAAVYALSSWSAFWAARRY